MTAFEKVALQCEGEMCASGVTYEDNPVGRYLEGVKQVIVCGQRLQYLQRKTMCGGGVGVLRCESIFQRWIRVEISNRRITIQDKRTEHAGTNPTLRTVVSLAAPQRRLCAYIPQRSRGVYLCMCMCKPCQRKRCRQSSKHLRAKPESTFVTLPRT